MRFDWRQVFPGTVQVTLVLDAFEAAELLDQAGEEGRIIAPNTVRGMPAIAFGPEIEPAPERPVAMDELRALPAKPDPKVVILPVICREAIEPEPAFDDRSPLSEAPPPRREKAEPEYRFFTGKGRVKRGEVTAADRKMVEDAIASGAVTITKCPPFKHALDASDPEWSDWKTKAGLARRRGAKNSAASRKGRAKPR